MKRLKFNLMILLATSTFLAGTCAQAEVKHRQINAANLLVNVSNESWQPEGFENGTVIPATYMKTGDITVNGRDDEPAWEQATEVEVPLAYGNIQSASLKALYTDREVFIRVRWADDTEDREHHPWVWDSEQDKFVAGPQVEDSVLLSFEAGCDWNPSLLAGYVYDFDGWHWLAARSDPLGQAIDINGHLQDQDMNDKDFIEFESRDKEDTWNMKYAENTDVDLHSEWDEIDRVYSLQPITETLYYKGKPDAVGRDVPAFFEQIAAPVNQLGDGSQTYPQFSPVKLEGGAGEVSASGQWEDGFWTVEFRRVLETPARHANDTIFQRLTQFSVHVFNQTEQIDEVSESKRLFLQFMPEEKRLVND